MLVQASPIRGIRDAPLRTVKHRRWRVSGSRVYTTRAAPLRRQTRPLPERSVAWQRISAPYAQCAHTTLVLVLVLVRPSRPAPQPKLAFSLSFFAYKSAQCVFWLCSDRRLAGYAFRPMQPPFSMRPARHARGVANFPIKSIWMEMSPRTI